MRKEWKERMKDERMHPRLKRLLLIDRGSWCITWDLTTDQLKDQSLLSLIIHAC